MTFNINGGGSLLVNAEDYKTFELINAPSLCRQIQVVFPAYSGITLSTSPVFECQTFDYNLFNDATGAVNPNCLEETVGGLIAFRV